MAKIRLRAVLVINLHYLCAGMLNTFVINKDDYNFVTNNKGYLSNVIQNLISRSQCLIEYLAYWIIYF